jgi:MraZ protein
MWEPGRFEKRRADARSKVQSTRKLLGAGSLPGTPGDGDGSARE